MSRVVTMTTGRGRGPLGRNECDLAPMGVELNFSKPLPPEW